MTKWPVDKPFATCAFDEPSDLANCPVDEPCVMTNRMCGEQSVWRTICSVSSPFCELLKLRAGMFGEPSILRIVYSAPRSSASYYVRSKYRTVMYVLEAFAIA